MDNWEVTTPVVSFTSIEPPDGRGGVQGPRSLKQNAKKCQVTKTKFHKVPGLLGTKGPWNPLKVPGR